MNKTIGLLAFGMFFLVALTSFSSAYYGGYFDPYYGQGNFDAYHSYTTQTSGGYYGMRTTTTTNYDRVSEKFWDGYSWVDRTTYTRDKRETPQYGDYGNSGYYPGYNSNRNYGNYYGNMGYNYGNYNSGSYGNYGGYNYGNYNYNYPRTSYW